MFAAVSVETALTAVVSAGAAYAIGMFPTASLVGRRIGRDPHKEGSGNPGASNVYRLGGKRAGLVVVAVDMAKGFAPTLAALLVWGWPAAGAAWLGAVAGHVWPAARKFRRGGKGMAATGGGALALDPIAAIVCAVLFAAVVRLTRIAALGSIAAVVAYPLLVAWRGWTAGQVAVAAAASAVVILRHWSNIDRLVRGREHRVARVPDQPAADQDQPVEGQARAAEQPAADQARVPDEPAGDRDRVASNESD